MKRKRIHAYLIALLLIISMIACVDNAYDLSDIDSTVGIKVNNLVIPLNVDEITLQNIFNLEEDSQIKEINGEYVYIEEGTFKSNPIEISSFIIPAPKIMPIKETVDLVSYDIGISPFDINIPDDYYLFSAEVENASTSFNFKAQNIDPALVNVDEIRADFIISLLFSFSELSAFLNSIEIENLALQLPKGLVATVSDQGVYNATTGKLSFNNSLISDNNLQKEIIINVSKIDANQAGVELINGELLLETTAYLSGKITIYGRNLKKPVDM